MLQRVFVFILLVCASIARGQDFQKQYKELSQKEDSSGLSALLLEWKKAKPQDPELYIAYFNYYVSRSKAELVSIDKESKGNGSFAITDSTSDKPVAYLNASSFYQSDILQKGFDAIDEGIAIHPRRLDMRFGKIYMLGKAENYPVFASEIIKTVEFGQTINNAWLWKEGKILPDATKFLLVSLQDYIATIYNTEQDSLLPLMRQISETVLKYYPDHVESLANIAITYLIPEDYDSALPYLLRAEKINPKDVIVLNNLGEAYRRKGDNANAKLYFEKVIKFGTMEEAEDAKQKIKLLK